MKRYVAYSDESAIGGSTGEFLVAGYAAAEDEWPCFERAWADRVLSGRYPIPYLHIIDIRDLPWLESHSVRYADSIVDEAIRVLYSTGALSAYCSVMRRDHLQAAIQSRYSTRRRIPRGLNAPDYACFMGFAGSAVRHCTQFHDDVGRVDFVVSEKENISKHMHEVLEILKTNPDAPPEVALIGTVTVGEMETCLPLQAADVLCWHIQRYFSGKYSRLDEGRMWSLLKERDGVLHHWERGDLDAAGIELVKNGLVR
jgi:hypothetical protein